MIGNKIHNFMIFENIQEGSYEVILILQKHWRVFNHFCSLLLWAVKNLLMLNLDILFTMFYKSRRKKNHFSNPEKKVNKSARQNSVFHLKKMWKTEKLLNLNCSISHGFITPLSMSIFFVNLIIHTMNVSVHIIS